MNLLKWGLLLAALLTGIAFGIHFFKPPIDQEKARLERKQLDSTFKVMRAEWEVQDRIQDSTFKAMEAKYGAMANSGLISQEDAYDSILKFLGTNREEILNKIK